MSFFSFNRRKNIRNKVIITISFLIVFCLIFSLTYAIEGGLPSSSIESNIVYIDEDAYESLEFNSNSIKLIPILDQAVEFSKNAIRLDFLVGGSLRNNIDDIVYDISLTDLEVDCNLLSPYLKWKLIKNGEVIEEGSLDYKFDTIKDGRLILTSLQQDLKGYNIDKTTYDKYSFYMWLSDSCQEYDLRKCIDSEDQSNLTNKKIKGKISVELNVGDKKELVRNPSDELNVNSCINGMESID